MTPIELFHEARLTEALEAFTTEYPLVLVVEDLHWSDRATLAWLASVALADELLVQAGYDTGSGVEPLLLRQAVAAGNPVRGFETMAQQLRVCGIDIAPLVCHVIGMDDTGTVALRTRTISRAGAATRARAFRLPGDLTCQCSMGHAALKTPAARHPGSWSGRDIHRGGHLRGVPCTSAW